MESIFEGLPCRHECCIFIKETLPISSLNIHLRWTNEYFDQSQLSDINESNDDEEEKEEKENIISVILVFCINKFLSR